MNYGEIEDWYFENKDLVVKLDIKTLVTSIAAAVCMDKRLSGKTCDDDDQQIAIFLSKGYAKSIWDSGKLEEVEVKKAIASGAVTKHNVLMLNSDGTVSRAVSIFDVGDRVVIANPREKCSRLKGYEGTIINRRWSPDALDYCVRLYEPGISQYQSEWFRHEELEKI